MQPDTFTFLQSARREMALAAAQGGDARAPYLHRGAQVLERLAFHEQGLQSLLAAALPRQKALLARLRELAPGPAMELPGELTPLAAFERINTQIDTLLAEISANPRTQEAGNAARVDALFREVSQFGYDLTRSIDEAARNQSREWEARRPSAPYIDVTAQHLTAYLRARYPEHDRLRVVDVEKLIGLNANEAFFLHVEGHPTWPERMILRRSLPVQIQPTSITEEFAILERLHGGPVPVAQPIFCEQSRDVLGQPFVVLERLRGEVLPLHTMGERGKRVYLKMAALMGKLHSLDPVLLPEFRRAHDGDAHAWLRRRIDVWEHEWKRGAREPALTVTTAFHWLRRHSAGFLAPQVIVHGDLDHRNLLVDGEEVVALIDWEVAHQGHPAEDLAYAREFVQGLMPWAEFVAVYEANGGKRITEEEMRYAKVLSNMLRVTTSMIAHAAYVDGVVDNFLIGTVRTLETEAACQVLHEAIQD
jgi:aminoglycoside phosphotransferase (APT) family kinase protein